MTLANRNGQALGWLYGSSVTGATTSQLNASGNWFAISFVPDSGRTINAARVFVSAVTGTLAGTDITCDLYDSTGTSGAPGSTIETGKVPTATITAAGWYNFTGFSTVLTAAQVYWFVFKNVNATQASNFATFRVVSSIRGDWLIGTATTRQDWAIATSSNSGSTWSRTAQSSALRVAYADGTYDGLLTSQVAATAVGDGVYSTRESGMKFTSPANAVLKVAGLAWLATTKTGSPTGNPRLGLWTGSTPTNLAYAQLISTTIQGQQWALGYFSSVQSIQPGTICRVTLAEDTQSDASGNRWNSLEFTWDTDSNSTPLLPWNGTATKTYFDGSNWTDSALGTSLFGHALLLDTVGEFGSLQNQLILQPTGSY